MWITRGMFVPHIPPVTHTNPPPAHTTPGKVQGYSDSFSITGFFQKTRWETRIDPYFNISHAHNVRVAGLAGVRYQDKLNKFQWRVSEKPAQIGGGLDRIYHGTQTVNIDDHGLGRRLSVAKTGSSQWVLWNPGPDRVRDFPDIHPGGEAEFVCLEAANTPMITVAAHNEFSWGQRITLNSL